MLLTGRTVQLAEVKLQAPTASATNMAGTTAFHGPIALMRDILAPQSGAVLPMRTVGRDSLPMGARTNPIPANYIALRLISV
jgi:hypothetical protein